MSLYQYTFRFEDGTSMSYEVDPDAAPTAPFDLPFWTELDYHKCPGCPIPSSRGAICPAAASLSGVLTDFQARSSTEPCEVEVVSDQRRYLAKVRVQAGLRSLIGLIMPSSGCPTLGRLRTLARYHLPFADHDETLFRVVGSYLMMQYVRERKGLSADWALDGVRELYEELQSVDMAFAARIREASPEDATVNALVSLFSLATMVSISLDEDLNRVLQRLGVG